MFIKFIIIIIVEAVVILGLPALCLRRALKKNKKLAESYETEDEKLVKNRFSISKVLFELLKDPKETIRTGMLGMYDHRGIWIWYFGVLFLTVLINIYTRKQLTIFFLIEGLIVGLALIWFLLNVLHLLLLKCCGIKISFNEAKYIIGMTVLGLNVINLGICIAEALLLLVVPGLNAGSWLMSLGYIAGIVWSGYILVRVLKERYTLSIGQSVKHVVVIYLLGGGMVIGISVLFAVVSGFTLVYFAFG